MAQPGDPNPPSAPDRDPSDPDDLVGFASPRSLAGQRRAPAPEPRPGPIPASRSEPTPQPAPQPRPESGPRPASRPEPEPAVGIAADAEPDLFDPPAPRPASLATPAPPPAGAGVPAWARETAPAPARTEPAVPTGAMGLYAVYALILFAVPTLGASALLGLAAVARRAPPDDRLAASHFIFQQRTLWIGVAAAVAGALLVVVNLGVFVLFALALWLIARGAHGVLRLKAGRPLDNPRTWLI